MKKLSILFFLLYSYLAFAQDAITLASFKACRTTEQRIEFLNDTNVFKINKPTYDAILAYIEAHKDNKAIFFWYYQSWRQGGYYKTKEISQKNIDKMLQMAKQNGWQVELVVAQFEESLNQFGAGTINEQQVYSAYLYYFEQIKQLGIDAFKNYHLSRLLHEIGRNFYQLGDYEKSLECLLIAENVAQQGTHFQTLILNLIEAIYVEKKDYANAIVYAKKIYDVNLNSKMVGSQAWYPLFWRGLSSLNIAEYMFEINNFKDAELYAIRGYKLYESVENLDNVEKAIAIFDALQVLIKLKLRLGKVEEVDNLLKKVEILKPHINFSDEGNYFKPLRFYQNYTQYFEMKKDYISAYRYVKLVVEMQDSLSRRNDKRKLWQTETRVKMENYQQQIKSAQEEKNLEARLRHATIVILVLFMAFALIVYLRISKYNKTITIQKNLLEQSLAEKEMLLKEVHHRVKNNLQIISGLLDKQARLTPDENIKKLIREGQDRVFSIALVHQNLYQSNNLSAVAIKSYLELLTKSIATSQAADIQRISTILEIEDKMIDIDTIIPLGLMLNELITNCYKYAFEDKKEGCITIRFKQNEQFVLLTVADNGVGLPEGFDIRQTHSLGLSLVRGLVRQLNGTLRYQTSTEGTTFEIRYKR